MTKKPRIFNREKKVSLINGFGKIGYSYGKNETGSLFYTTQKINWKWIEALNILPRNNKTHGRKHKERAPLISTLTRILFGYDTTSRQQKQKQVWLYETEKLLHHKRNSQQNEKVTNGVGENICKPSIWEGDNPKYIRNTTQ